MEQGFREKGQVSSSLQPAFALPQVNAGNETRILYTNPQTSYLLNNQPTAFADFQPGMPVTANYYVNNGRHFAGRIFGRRR